MSIDMRVNPTSKRLGEYLECEPVAIEAAIALQEHPLPDTERRRIGELLLELDAVTLDQLLVAVQQQRVARLRACPLFSVLSDSELKDLSDVFQEISAVAGQQFIAELEDDPCLYVLASGALKVYRIDENGEEVPLARVFPGEPVGEMGYFADGIRSASVRALEPSELLRASYDDLTDCFESVPAVAAAFMDVVTHRLRKTNLLYQETHFDHDPGGGTLGHLGRFLMLTGLDELEGRVDELLKHLVHTASSLTDADRASLFLTDPDTGELWSKVAQGAEIKEIRIPGGSGVVGWSVEHRELVNVEDAYADERFNPQVDRRTGYRTHTVLCAPVRDREHRVVGGLQVINKSVGVFTEDDESMIRAVARQAALGIENINLFRSVLESHRRATSLLELSTAIITAPDQLALSARTAEILARLLRCEQARLYYLERGGESVWCALQQGDALERTSYRVDDCLAGYTVSTGAAAIVRDAYEDERFDPAWDTDRGLRTRNALSVPVHDHGGRLLGVIECINRVDGVFDEDDRELVQGLAAQLGLARMVSD